MASHHQGPYQRQQQQQQQADYYGHHPYSSRGQPYAGSIDEEEEEHLRRHRAREGSVWDVASPDAKLPTRAAALRGLALLAVCILMMYLLQRAVNPKRPTSRPGTGTGIHTGGPLHSAAAQAASMASSGASGLGGGDIAGDGRSSQDSIDHSEGAVEVRGGNSGSREHNRDMHLSDPRGVPDGRDELMAKLARLEAHVARLEHEREQA